jgi:hypothetical protein
MRGSGPAVLGMGLILAMAAGLTAPARAQRAEDDETEAEPVPGPRPDIRWHTLHTPHFHIHFYEDERPLAAHTAAIAERAYRLITRYLNWQPSGRINITLNDQTDYADGFASSVPLNFIFGYGAPPGAMD